MSDWKFCKMVGRGSPHRDLFKAECNDFYWTATTKRL